MTTIAGNRPDPRIRRPYVSKLRSAAAESARRGQGQIFFLAGDAGSGRSATLRAFWHDLREMKPRPKVIAATFVNGQYTPMEDDASQTAPGLGSALDFLGNLLAVPAALAGALAASHPAVGLLGNPIVALVAQLLQLGAVSEGFIQQSIRSNSSLQTNPALLLKQALRQAVADGPVVCVLDQVDRGDAAFLADFLFISANELVRDRPLMIVASMEGPARIAEDVDEKSPLFVPASLARRGLATWLHLSPMSKDEVRDWLRNADPSLVAHLHAVTGGNPGWLALLWDDLWRSEKVQPHPVTYQWQTASGYERASLGTVNDILGERLKILLPDATPAERLSILDLLATAALEGPVFTAAPLAQTLGWDADELIDLCDDWLVQSEDQPYGILHEVEAVEIPVGEGMRSLWRYSFSSDLFWYTLNEHGLTAAERSQRAGLLADQLAGAYSIENRRIAHILARLYTEAGNAAQSHQFRWVAHIHEQAAALYAQAQLLLDADIGGWDVVEHGWAADFLNSTAGTLYNNYPYRTVLELATAACTIARHARLTGKEARALNLQGIACQGLGRMQEALGYYEQSLPLFRAMGDRSSEATTLTYIGRVYSALGEQGKSLAYFEQSLPLLRAVGNRRGEAYTFNYIGRVYADLGEPGKALAYYEQALPLLRAVGDRSGEAATLNYIGAVYSALGEPGKALAYYEEALPLLRAVGDRSGEATTLTNMGAVYAALGEPGKALAYYEEALPIRRAVGDRGGEAATLNNMGGVYADLGEPGKALAYFEEALPIRRAVGDRSGEAATLTNIGMVYKDQGRIEDARLLLQQARSLFEAVQSPKAAEVRRWLDNLPKT